MPNPMPPETAQDQKAKREVMKERFKGAAKEVMSRPAGTGTPGWESIPERAPEKTANAPPPKAEEPAKAPPAEPAAPEKPRNPDGTFKTPEDPNWAKARETMAAQKAALDARDAKFDALEKQIRELKDALAPKADPTAGMTPEQKATYEAEQKWVTRNVDPAVAKMVAPVMEELRQLREEREAAKKAEENAKAIRTEFATWADVRGIAESEWKDIKVEAASNPEIAEKARHPWEAFEMARKNVVSKRKGASPEQKEAREAEKRQATPHMGHSLPAPETTNDDWHKAHREAMERKDFREAKRLRKVRFSSVASRELLAPTEEAKE